MPSPTLPPEEDALLRFGVVQAALRCEGVHKTEFDRKIQGESSDHLHKLVEQGFLRKTGEAAFLPTVHGQLYVAGLPGDAKATLDAVIWCGRNILNSNDREKSVEVDQLVRTLIDARAMFPLGAAKDRFWFDCSLFGLEPYIQVLDTSPDGKPARVSFAAPLLRLNTAEDLLARVEADREAASLRASMVKKARPRKRTRAHQQVVNIHAETIGALQTGAKSTANVTQNISFDATEALKLIDAIRAAAPTGRQDVHAALEQVTVEVQANVPDPARLRANVGRLWRLAADISTIAPFVMQLAKMLGVALPGP